MLGAVADDFTGATDLAIMLRRNGHRVAVVIEEHDPDPAVREGLDAVVVALKSRTAPVAEAVAASERAVDRLRGWGADRLYVKYCSTFDSTDRGNIGPVLDAVADRAGAGTVVVAPALPANGRTVYQGHLFVGAELLERSPMRHHPLTPMTRSRVAELLAPQTPHAVDEIHLATVRRGPGAVRAALAEAADRYVVVDTVDDDDLRVLGAAVAGAPVVSGGSGLALGLPDPGTPADDWRPAAPGRVRLTLCGSASAATRRQVADAARTAPSLRIDPVTAVRDPDAETARLTAWVREQPVGSAPVVYATAEPGDVVAEVDGAAVAPAVEAVLAAAGHALVADGTVSRLLVAGGETSGAVVRSLGAGLLRIGPEIAPGICWTAATTADGRAVTLALKSGNFGPDDLFTSAWDVLA
ncbi:putative pyridoxine biosynthesis protein (from glycolaldehide) [Pseudonocardia sp. Ae168_Ps1]|uniref:3-oxo-tetronate kinase n=1 Tax=unclassified Pseudonocardia TaxID=2619320 RepID=UPI00094ACCD8|nr:MULTISPECIES: 3-oxo-tetronate kinase [unclassified Pseudonocardia]OLL72342.1 putative pyridoxine biosynthesis protein [Pseudonocardia sp. Ae150A_Ps1]OLL78314.1 putative pyridoxine biosynthesis protein (from glycolaldehide) [Pseudonocardia sp. Ae168_Ps1]OLL87560.1 putative pyridoxine biosynthesis protein (from glycolaldehide) [Pseudonocardia sp. Ae263_Ps1]OLL92410.1 putative pyridoxine biosynthesis protein (from glycolaldehide) [Pseudonocardia sp. Ae356_Ps1]